MVWRSFIVGFAALAALGFGARAQTAAGTPGASWPAAAPAAQTDSRQVTPVQLPVRSAPPTIRSSEGQPRYATMVPPTQDDLADQPAPLAAPTNRVQVGPNAATPQAGTPPAATPATQQQVLPRYATQTPMQEPRETVRVTGLRQSEDGLYHLGPGDKLRITVFNEPDLTGEFAIDGQGFVRLPLVGQIQAAGLTTFGLEARIGDGFTNGGYLINPRIAVEVTTYRPFYIIGEIAKPGEYAYVNAMSAPNAIALAGGYTDRAVEDTIMIRRQGSPKELEFRADESTPVYPGDVIRVQRTTYWSIMSLLAPLISPIATAAYLLK